MVAASYLCLAIHLCFSRVYTTTRHRWAIKRTSSLCSMVYTITGHRCLVVRVRQSLTSGCAEVISEGLVMIRVCDDRAVNQNDLPLFAQLRVVRFKATTKSFVRIRVIVPMAYCQKSWHDSAWFPIMPRMVIDPILAQSATVCRTLEVQQSARHNDLPLFAQLRVVRFKATTESVVRLLVVVQMAYCQTSWHDSAWFPV